MKKLLLIAVLLLTPVAHAARMPLSPDGYKPLDTIKEQTSRNKSHTKDIIEKCTWLLSIATIWDIKAVNLQYVILGSGSKSRFTPLFNIKCDYSVVDVPTAQTPVPAALWLFGSALLGLFGIKRKAGV